MAQQEKHYAALAPIMALAGVFVAPVASTILPLILYFIFRKRNMEFAKLVALRAADMAFSIQFLLILASGLLAAWLFFYPMPNQQAQQIISNLTFVAIVCLIASLLMAAIQSFRGKAMNYVLSLRIAERLLQHSKT